jgi:pantoate--beta-alanine ligase
VVKIIETIADFRAWRGEIGRGKCVPFVPTMGALHEGHASLVREARARADGSRAAGRGSVVASIFVNPTQFGPQEDFARYPRTLDTDLAMLEAAGCDVVFVPAVQEVYPERTVAGSQKSEGVSVDPGHLGTVLEGAIRPGHFRGVCTVVAKLLHITQPTHLLLGQKDYQQQAILRQMCTHLDMPVEVVTCPTMREKDGLAMSSRNRYLSAEERSRAVALVEALDWAKTNFERGEQYAGILEDGMRQRVEARGLVLQYAVVADARTLELFREQGSGQINRAAVLLIAARLGTTRLIDNMQL